MNKFLKGHQGFTLVEVVIAAGMMGLLALMVMRLSENSQRSVHSVVTRFAIQEKVQEIQYALKDVSGCTLNFKDYYNANNSLDIAKLPILKNKNGRVISTLDEKDQDGFTITEQSSKWDSNGEVTLTVVFNRGPKSIGGTIIKKEFTLFTNWVDKTTGDQILIADKDADGKDIQRSPNSSEVTSNMAFSSCSASIGLVSSSGGESPINLQEVCDSIEGSTWNETSGKCVVGAVWLCLEETRQLAISSSGGTTTNCSPNVFVPGTKLTGGKDVKACELAGGAYYFDTALNIAICRFDAEICPGGWVTTGHRSYMLVKNIPAAYQPELTSLITTPPLTETPFNRAASVIITDDGHFQVNLIVDSSKISFAVPADVIYGWHDIATGKKRWEFCSWESGPSLTLDSDCGHPNVATEVTMGKFMTTHFYIPKTTKIGCQ